MLPLGLAAERGVCKVLVPFLAGVLAVLFGVVREAELPVAALAENDGLLYALGVDLSGLTTVQRAPDELADARQGLVHSVLGVAAITGEPHLFHYSVTAFGWRGSLTLCTWPGAQRPARHWAQATRAIRDR